MSLFHAPTCSLLPLMPCLYVVCSVTVKEVNRLIIKHNYSLCKMNHCRFIQVQKTFLATPVY